MSNLPLVPYIMEHVSELLRQRGDVAAAYLLGSALRGPMRPESDVDIALLATDEQGISLQGRLSLAAELERRLGRRVDIGVITRSNLIYAAEAILGGRRIVTFDEERAAMMETRLLGCYLQLRQDRREVENAYRAA
jgi:uncharacterized protein